jgi:hypothetical protein
VALGAASQGTVALVVATAARIVAIGIVVGIGVVLITRRVVAAILYAISPHDPSLCSCECRGHGDRLQLHSTLGVMRPRFGQA